ncbi:MAG: hypothetical protein RLZZ54_2188 [Cyanobacteriota bacterium]|jgi:hypothetical protein
MSETTSRTRRRERFFPWFLLATLLPLLVMPFTNLEGNAIQRLLLPVTALYLVIMALRIAPEAALRMGAVSLLPIYRALGVVCASLMWLPFILGHHVAHHWHFPILAAILAFYVATAVVIVLILARVDRVNERVLCLGAAGYIHLGLTGGQLATTLEVLRPGSFSLGQMLPGEELVERLSYFSFVTLGSLGYGDVLPATAVAESFAVLLSITATLYITLMIGLLLSRYINSRV